MGTEIHWIAILVAAVAGFGVGAVWYSVLFGKAWIEARGLTEEQIRAGGGNPAVLFGLTFLLDLLMAFVLDHVLGTYGSTSLGTAAMVAGGTALGFVIPAMAVNYLFQQATMKHFLIDAGHWLAVFLVMGVALSLLS
jgi:hypothetical protein